MLVSRGSVVDMRVGGIGQKDRNATALYFAARAGHLKVCEFLLQAGADVNAATDEGATALSVCRSPVIAKILLDHGADIQALVTKSENMLYTGNEADPSLPLLKLFLEVWQTYLNHYS